MAIESDKLRERLDRATAHLDPPYAVVDLTAFDANSAALADRAAGKPVRLASKSVRSRELINRALARPGWRGVMAFTLPEAIWLVRAGVSDDVLVAYPSVDRAALAELAADPALAAAITLMIDGTGQLDLIDDVRAPGQRAELRLCLDLDASWRPMRGRVHVGVRRSPVHSARAAAALAATVAGRPGFRLVGLMSYEAQIAGLGDAPPGQTLLAGAIRLAQRGSYRELLARRGAAVAAVREHADLEFVNGGGTGSVAATSADPAVTEVTAGSGLYGPTLFDAYRAWRPTPAAFFACAVVRRPTPELATVLGGGWIASGPAADSRLPRPWLPAGLKLVGSEGAGEVQTPLSGAAAATLQVGDRVWFRHAKAGELCERVNELHLVEGDAVVATVPTYRGEGQAFL
ncbi:amino acid deaminase/aldolase [Micromonospora zamorensis]|uniref:D-serine deaminase-like pyridoxal phosphate-dependent protein n=1 Tax=Micromonospora jinlongensis TaxID=1287877 RepID=A0A7Y9X3F5_9ACTN|nr:MULTISPECIES: amino acid deaminase/aldolase [Micromonospora]MBQ1036969.1 amino acid deaminase/aldolase [Micromonospora sp. C81]NYH44541.1 D-serine deaminase-like pyridoxal phosphate-dependent protein [Micromonospora jinlongensis]TQJ19961.1 D-serine deaminase-like pyridoxal phosphate-dependent protein [Micromonospora sp. A202]WTE85151.1 amino acid deaminase/aldolase [Micromonospora zamorensis]